MSKLLEKITKLIDVKSIVTLTLTIGFLNLVNNKLVVADKFTDIYMMIICFYFGVQSTKSNT